MGGDGVWVRGFGGGGVIQQLRIRNSLGYGEHAQDLGEEFGAGSLGRSKGGGCQVARTK